MCNLQHKTSREKANLLYKKKLLQCVLLHIKCISALVSRINCEEITISVLLNLQIFVFLERILEPHRGLPIAVKLQTKKLFKCKDAKKIIKNSALLRSLCPINQYYYSFYFEIIKTKCDCL